jgi:hypothetical protein
MFLQSKKPSVREYCSYSQEMRKLESSLPTRFPEDARGHGAQREPEEQHGVVQRNSDPLPELPVVEELRGLRDLVEGRVGLPRDIGTRPGQKSCWAHDSLQPVLRIRLLYCGSRSYCTAAKSSVKFAGMSLVLRMA